jgi:alkylation response protein AidB-like acyl-CoA dehydrogenase
MDLSLTAAQKKLQETARDFLKKELPWTTMQKINESDSGFSPELWKKTVDLGWVGMSIPKNYGGGGYDMLDIAVIFDEMGRALLPGPYLSAILCGSIINEAGSDKQKKDLLPQIASGKKIIAFAFTEPEYGWGPEAVQLSAKNKAGNFVLNGTKRFVFDAQIADQLIVAARTTKSANPARGITLFLVDKKAKGLSSRLLRGDEAEKLSELTFDSVEVSPDNIIGTKDAAWNALNKPLNRAMLALSAYMVGTTQHIMDLTIFHSQNRVQFGQPVGAFQWVQGYVIDQANQLERSRWFTYEALWKVDSNKPQKEQDEAVALAKATASDAVHIAAHQAHEVHAGKGIMKQFELYLYSDKARAMYSYLGDPAYHRKRVAGMLGL